MPHSNQTVSAANADQRLSQLIKLKQLEKPDATFWTEFQQEYRSRQLTSFVQIQPLHTRLRKAFVLAARKVAPPVAAAGAVALTFFAVSNTQFLSDTGATNEATVVKAEAPQYIQTEPEALFIVQAQDESDARNSKTEKTVYQVNVLRSGIQSSNSYHLNATPVTYSYGTEDQSIGAQVISKQSAY